MVDRFFCNTGLLMKQMYTSTGIAIPKDAVDRHGKCVESYSGRGLPPCQECNIHVRSACMQVRAHLSIIKKQEASYVGNYQRTGCEHTPVGSAVDDDMLGKKIRHDERAD
jgi:hypothetical protein